MRKEVKNIKSSGYQMVVYGCGSVEMMYAFYGPDKEIVSIYPIEDLSAYTVEDMQHHVELIAEAAAKEPIRYEDIPI